ncbi:hypothetical protein ALC62_08823 [Cyphomyrmex costatus]|uniref:Uncharacterized protein n=1 Tax=Cyphomyrmex costatus TaxID=456900 RepID=A0A195CIR7_9HYME|nr:hypothetical protein ALC62_08823 [Cyphomyrmex costatus]
MPTPLAQIASKPPHRGRCPDADVAGRAGSGGPCASRLHPAFSAKGPATDDGDQETAARISGHGERERERTAEEEELSWSLRYLRRRTCVCIEPKGERSHRGKSEVSEAAYMRRLCRGLKMRLGHARGCIRDRRELPRLPYTPRSTSTSTVRANQTRRGASLAQIFHSYGQINHDLSAGCTAVWGIERINDAMFGIEHAIINNNSDKQYDRSGGSMSAFLPEVTYPRGGQRGDDGRRYIGIPKPKRISNVYVSSFIVDFVLFSTVRRRDGEGGRGGGKEGGRKEGEEEEEMPTEAVAAAAVTSRLVFLITPDPGRVEEEELLSDVSIMTRLCTEVRIRTNCRGATSKRSPIEIPKEPTIDDRAYGQINRGRPARSSST